MCVLRYKSSSVLVIQTMFWLLKWCSRWHQPFLAMKVLIDRTNGKHTLTTGIWSQAPPGQTHFVWAVELEFGRRATSVLHTISRTTETSHPPGTCLKFVYHQTSYWWPGNTSMLGATLSLSRKTSLHWPGSKSTWIYCPGLGPAS